MSSFHSRKSPLSTLTPLLIFAVGAAVLQTMMLGFQWKLLAIAGGVNTGLVLVSSVLFWIRQRGAETSVRQQLEDLCQTDLSTTSPDSLDALPAGAWQETLGTVRKFIEDRCHTLRESEQKRAGADIRSRRLQTERDRYDRVLSGLAEPLLVIDHYDEVVLTNSSADALFDIALEEDEKPRVDEMVDCPPLVELLQDVRRRRAKAQRTVEFQLTDKDDLQRWFRASCRNLETDEESPDGAEANGAVAVLTDIGPQKALQKRHAEFISAVSHEMKTPLSGIKAYVELLADGDAEDEETREEFLEVINSQADRLQRLIDNLLNLARIEAGVVSVDKQHHSLNGILEEASGVLAPAAEQKEISFVSDLSPMYLGVTADRDLLLQAAINLMSNAIKYTPEGGEVTVRSRMVASDMVFEVEDNGVGLSEEDCERVFSKFYRVRKDQKMAPGTGLGLPLAKHVVEDVHGGQLQVRSTANEGSTFSVSLPGHRDA